MNLYNLLADRIGSTIEFQSYGVNAITISFVATVGLTSVQGWGLWQQSRLLWQARSAPALSIPWLTYFSLLQIVVFIYGASLPSAALMINGLLVILYVPILVGLQKFKGYSRANQAWAAVLLAAIVVMLFSDRPDIWFAAAGFGGLFSAALQPLEMWWRRSARGVSRQLIGTLLLSNAFWIMYGVAISDWAITSINISAGAIFGTTALLAHYYRHHPELTRSLPAATDANLTKRHPG